MSMGATLRVRGRRYEYGGDPMSTGATHERGSDPMSTGATL
jgi:hypothetical protein